MGSHANIEGEVWAMSKSTKRKAMKRLKDTVPTEDLGEEGAAEVARNFNLTVKGGQYNDVSVGASATVRVRCAQDDETINKALETTEALAEAAIKKYYPQMDKVVQKLLDDKDY